MSEAKEVVIERIQKLLRFSKDKVANEAEIASALRHARRLMEKYNLEEADLTEEQLTQAIIDEFIYERATAIDSFDIDLAQVPCIICGVRAFLRATYGQNKRGNHSRKQQLRFYGQPRDIAVAKALYVELLATMRALARYNLGEDYLRLLPSFGVGFVTRLKERAREAVREESAEAGTTAIVLHKDAALDNYGTNVLKLGVGKSRRMRGINNSAYSMGRSEANRVSLGTSGLPKGPAPQRKEIAL